MGHWWCYIGFGHLFKSVYNRDMTEDEKAAYMKFSRDQINQWVIDHMALAQGLFVGVDVKGYLAFTYVDIFLKGIYDGELKFEDPETIIEYRTSLGHPFKFRIINNHPKYQIIVEWNNGSNDYGSTSMELDEKGFIRHFTRECKRFPEKTMFNYDLDRWTLASDLSTQQSSKFVNKGLK